MIPITKREGREWKKDAIRLARAIIRFQNSNSVNHTDNTIKFAYFVLRKGK